MRMNLLLQREPLPDILCSTLSSFWSRYYEKQVQVTWHPKPPSRSDPSNNSAQLWYVNFYLNSVFSPSADQRIFEPILREYGRSLKWYLRLPQRIYLGLAISSLWTKNLANAHLLVSPGVVDAEKLLVVPGNHKIRVLDFKSHLVYGIHKLGFRHDTFVREIDCRQLAARCGIKVPGLFEVSDSWFCEHYLSGTPTNRLANPNLAFKAEQVALDMLRKLSLETMVEASVTAYVQCLVDKIAQYTSLIVGIQHEVKLDMLRTVASLATWILDNTPSATIRISMSHGDLQPGNILVNTEGVWIIDWEYGSYRIDGYDWLVLAFQSRRPTNLHRRIDNFVQSGIADSTQANMPHWLASSWRTRVDRTTLCALFFLEELLLHLEEATEPLLFYAENEILGIYAETSRWANRLNIDCKMS